MDVQTQLLTDHEPGDLLVWIDDLERYPIWMRLVHAVERLDDDPQGPAWRVELRARLGPFARSKKLRMVRTHCDSQRIVFERVEGDGRVHAPWILALDLSTMGPPATTTRLDVSLHYGGSLWTAGALEKVLADEVERGRDQLLTMLRTR